MRRRDVYLVLDKKIDEFFPTTARIPFESSDMKGAIKEKYFPFHTRDYPWLASYMKEKFNIKSLRPAFLEEYLKSSYAYYYAVQEYEQKVVEWQVHALQNNIKEQDDFIESPNCDKKFRKKLVQSLKEVGLPLEVIEEGIEKNIFKWRDKYMHLAFLNTYSPVELILGKQIPLADPAFETAWTKLRVYDYYRENKESIDKYGVIIPDMKMSSEKVKELRFFVRQKGKERLEEINADSNTKAKILRKKY